jgi:apolipoprotein N-acyltransferase
MPRYLASSPLDRFLHTIRTPLGTILGLIVSFAALWIAIHYLQPYPELRVTNLLACFTFSASVAFVYWAILWVELIQINPIMAVASVLFPPAVGSVVAAHPENTKYSYAFHLVALAIATVFYYYTTEVTDLSPFEHFDTFR